MAEDTLDDWKGETMIRGRKPSPKEKRIQRAAHASKVHHTARVARGEPALEAARHSNWFRWIFTPGKNGNRT